MTQDSATEPAGDQARRIVERRKLLGITIPDLAGRTGMAAGYLNYLESSATADPGRGTLGRLAAALDTTPEALAGSTATRAAGGGRAGPRPHLEHLNRADCIGHLSSGGLGRIVVSERRGPVAFPVNFRYFEDTVVFRTEDSAAVIRSLPATVGFEVDCIDETMSEGWSVLVTGIARRIIDAPTVDRIRATGLEAWAGGERDAFIAIDLHTVTGRRIRQALSPQRIPRIPPAMGLAPAG